MRIWDVHPKNLCQKHLLGEHSELHAIWNIITKNKKGYSLHPETLRWVGKLKALYFRHGELVEEMGRRGYNHKSPLNESLAVGSGEQDIYLNTLLEQVELLKNKNCSCGWVW